TENIDPEQVRKLAAWGLTQNDRASFVGWSQSLISLGFSSIYAFRRQAIKNRIEQGHGTQSNPFAMKDLWPSASRFWGMVQILGFSGNSTDRPRASARNSWRPFLSVR